MTNRTNLKLAALLGCLLMLSACAGTTATTGTTTPPPVPAPITVTNAIALVATANDALVKAAIAARDAGTISQADCSAIESVSTAISNAGLQMDTELRNVSDAWAVQQQKLIALLQSTGLSQLKARISATAYAVVVGLITAANQLSVSLGGPTI
jgi:hypothetical protein